MMSDFEKSDPNPHFTGNIRQKELNTYIFDSAIGPIQIGIPPETIKTSMKQGERVPQIYVLPHILFAQGINYGEIEFPLYFNLFMKEAFIHPENKVTMIGTKDQLQRVEAVIQESLFGPKPDQIYIEEDISFQRKAAGYNVNLAAERAYLAFTTEIGESIPLSSLANFIEFDPEGIAVLHRKRKLRDLNWEADPQSLTPHLQDEVEIKIVKENGMLKFFEDGILKGVVDTDICEAPALKEVHISGTPFDPPQFGVTFLGTSHGFDPQGQTTGFIMWVNGNGILVDPPVHTTDYLQKHGIKHRFVNKIILTHCHSDHDSGVLQKILEGEKIQIYTTKTIHESYKRKANAITGLNIEDYYDFIPVQIGDPIKIHGASFEFDYSLHTIPTIRFKVSYKGRSISYSSDTKFDPEAFSELLERSIINPQRELSLRTFLFDADVIIHEAGVPPIHTDLACLNDLPTEIKKKILIVHSSHIPEEVERTVNGQVIKVKIQDLKIPAVGLENTLILPVEEYPEGYFKARRRLQILSETFYFRNLSPVKLLELFSVMEEEQVPAGTIIIQSGEESEKFYLIELGQVEVYHEGKKVATLVSGDSFGENALWSEHRGRRSATVVAKTATNLLTISKKDFLEGTGRPDIDTDLKKVSRYRPFLSGMLAKTPLFKNLNTDQIEEIATLIQEEFYFKKGSIIIQQGDRSASLFLVKEGSIRLERSDGKAVKELVKLGPGDSFGEISLLTGFPRTATAIADEDSVVLELKRENFEKILNKYQNIHFNIVSLVEQRLERTKWIDQELRKNHQNLG